MIPVAAHLAALAVDVRLLLVDGRVLRQCRRCERTSLQPIDPARYVPQPCSRCERERAK